MAGEPELRLLLEDQAPLEQPRRSRAAMWSLVVHLGLGALVMILPSPAPPLLSGRPFATQVTPLVAPPAELTQKAPNQGKASREVSLQGLLSRPSPIPNPPAAPAQTMPAAPREIPAPAAPAPAPKPVPEQPKPETPPAPVEMARNLPAVGSPTAPPIIQPEEKPPEKPKNPFETVGAYNGSPKAAGAGAGRVVETPKKPSMEEAARASMQSSGGGGLTVGDVGVGTGGLGTGLSGGPGVRNESSLELLSDSGGVDFRPYLIQVMSRVKRNWTAVLPESARLGQKGRVLIQFAIAKDGNVAKLVIATNSGTDALDRAAVAGISASNPFPPLPTEYRGNQLRLQLTFLYNVPAR